MHESFFKYAMNVGFQSSVIQSDNGTNTCFYYEGPCDEVSATSMARISEQLIRRFGVLSTVILMSRVRPTKGKWCKKDF